MQLSVFLRRTALLGCLTAATLAHAAKKAPPIENLSSYPAQENHKDESVTIAVDPFDTRSKADFFRIDYVGHNFLPLRVLIRNDSDKTLDLTQVRIQLVPAKGDRVPAALPSEINRRLFHIKDTQAKHIPGVPIVTYHKTPVDKKILDDQKEFGINTTTVAPHSTLDGFLIYDLEEIDSDTPLEGADIYIKEIYSGSGDSKKQLFPFSIPLDSYLKTKEKPAK